MEDNGLIFEASNHITASAAADLFQNETLTSSSEVLDSLWISNSSSASFHGENKNSSTMKPIIGQSEKGENYEEDYEKSFHHPEKKRRLAADQVGFLERSFEVENKLEPARKIHLAKELNLQPRQVAIWFQNRRARYKTKQLEKDYGFLKSNYDKLKLDFDCLQKHNDKLKHEFQMLTQKLKEKEKGKQDSTTCDEFPTKEMESNAQKPNPIPKLAQNGTNVSKMMIIHKQEDANSVISAKSDVIDSNSTDGNHSSFLEPADSSNVFENQSDEDENLSINILRFPKTEFESYIDPNEGCFGYPIEDQTFWLWA